MSKIKKKSIFHEDSVFSQNKVIYPKILGLILLLFLASLPNKSEISHQNSYVNEYSVDNISVKAAADPNAFISVWNTNLVATGTSNNLQIRLPLEEDGTYNFNIDWGDGSNNVITRWDQAAKTHNYSTPGIYTLNITGVINGWNFYYEQDRIKITDVSQWGCLQLGNRGFYFEGCRNLILTATDSLDLTGTNILTAAFSLCESLSNIGDMSGWDVSNVTDMDHMFYNCERFNQPLDTWDVSNVTSMRGMFCYAESFNQNISGWDVSNVTDMEHMFSFAYVFNQPLANWDVSNVTDMNEMFRHAEAFNQNISRWDVSGVTNMESMFYFAESFNQNISGWDVSSVTDMMAMFDSAAAFNQNISGWDVSSVTDMRDMFYNAVSFNQSLANWDVSLVTTMRSMFNGASAFNQNISAWDVSSVTNMRYMFGRSVFNQNISRWDVSSVTDMSGMFSEASAFNQPLGDWDVSSVTTMASMFYLETLSPENYDNILIGWSQLSLKIGVTYDAGLSQFSASAGFAKDEIIENFNWVISDGGLLLTPPMAPTLIEISGSNTSGIINLSWSTIYNADEYHIYRNTSEIIDVDDMLLIANTTTLHFSDSVDASGTYYYVVVASNTLDFSPISNCMFILIDLLPQSLILNDIPSTSSTGDISLSWNVIVGVIEYQIYRETSEITDISDLNPIKNIAETSYSDNGLSNGTYYYLVVALINEEYLILSNIQSVIVEIPPSNTNTGNTDGETDSGSLENSPGIPGYSIELLFITISISIFFQKRKGSR